VLFPEGTRTTHQPLNHFHASFTLIARRAGAPIQTVFIDTDSPYLRKGWPLWRLPPLPIRFTVRLGQRFAPADDYLALRTEIEAYFAAGVHVPRAEA
jgi:1-acyl-sn-glycerol-3-phosphate acyltransferase